MIAYRNIVQQWIVPMGEALKLPLVSMDSLRTNNTLPLLVYDVTEPYIDCSPHALDTGTGDVEKLVEMEWLLLICGDDRMEMVERCRDMLGWLWTEGLEHLARLSVSMVRISPAQWKTDPNAGLGLQVRLRMKDRFVRSFTSIDKIELTSKEEKGVDD
ncbi:hypothetical protein MH117_16630 [Paenibacillus sp. ACRRX]|uniref:phage neck terminator protein n=1 Tax=unclassified Paenibacillus TaxID=185978 RepID=UPI001EF5F9F0|nr:MULTISPECIES: hypothetical protein [unclassified Paenibacillus]MCG7409045.1 hypothetical protein [Paenibacillus sp. ACRRX]MDK8181955.1 hypothetical protein [Paenibacillus sp. UMB4589-SE434]